MATLSKDIFVTVNGERKKLEGNELDQFLAQSTIDQAAYAARQAEAEARAQAKAELLERLGLTQEEFNTLIA